MRRRRRPEGRTCVHFQRGAQWLAAGATDNRGFDQGKPAVRRGRKARGLVTDDEMARLPTATSTRAALSGYDKEVTSVMPMVIHPRIGRNARRLATLTATLACFGGAGVAQAACPTAPTTAAFAKFGDTAQYSLAPGGSFEPGQAAWTLNGNSIVAGNETHYLNSPDDANSLSIQSGTSVVSPEICVDATTPFLRLVAKKPTKGNIKVEALYTDDLGVPKVKTLGSVIQGGLNANGDYSDWAPSPALKLSTLLPLAKFATGTMTVQLRLTAAAEPGAWQVDDVFIDPYRS